MPIGGFHQGLGWLVYVLHGEVGHSSANCAVDREAYVKLYGNCPRWYGCSRLVKSILAIYVAFRCRLRGQLRVAFCCRLSSVTSDTISSERWFISGFNDGYQYTVQAGAATRATSLALSASLYRRMKRTHKPLTLLSQTMMEACGKVVANCWSDHWWWCGCS